MIMRMWRAIVLPGMGPEYDAFARDVSQPMFEQQAGFRGVIFARDDEHCLVITLWKDHDSIEALAGSASYGRTVGRISGLLRPETTTEVYEVDGVLRAA